MKALGGLIPHNTDLWFNDETSLAFDTTAAEPDGVDLAYLQEFDVIEIIIGPTEPDITNERVAYLLSEAAPIPFGGKMVSDYHHEAIVRLRFTTGENLLVQLSAVELNDLKEAISLADSTGAGTASTVLFRYDERFPYPTPEEAEKKSVNRALSVVVSILIFIAAGAFSFLIKLLVI